MTEPETIKRLGSRFPCCDRACTHELEIGVPRELKCKPCVRTWSVVMVECDPRVQQMAGRRVAKVEWTIVTPERRNASAPTP